MAEPINSLMPTAYDDDSSLLGDLIDQRSFQLQASVTASDTTIPVSGNLGDINLPVYVTFIDATGEIFYCETIAGDNKSFTSVTRGVRGTLAQSHTAAAGMKLAFSGQHLDMLKEGTIAAEQFLGLVGADASKAATPDQNEVYVASDTDKLYIATVAGAWEWAGNRDDHADLDDLNDSSIHTQYQNDARALTWHDGLTGGHATGGDSHTHGLSAASGAGRVQAGIAASRSSTPTYERELYYETDTEILYIAKGTAGPSDWVKITGAPTGSIAPFLEADITSEYGGACPTGWSRYTALDDKFPRGAPTGVTSPLNTGGGLTHEHDYNLASAHTHTVPSIPLAMSSVGNHYHWWGRATGGGPDSIGRDIDSSRVDYPTEDGGIHQHSMTIPAHDTNTTKRTSDDAAGIATGTTDTKSNIPSYQEVIFCVKD